MTSNISTKFLRGRKIAALAALLCAGSLPAFATNFNFTFQGAGIAGSGTFTGTSTGFQDEYLITGVTGDIALGPNLLTDSDMYAVGTFGGDPITNNDNDFYSGGQPGYFNYYGLAFNLVGGYYAEFFQSDFGPRLLIGQRGVSGQNIPITFNGPGGTDIGTDPPPYMPPMDPPTNPTSVTPEPSSLMLFGTGILGMASAYRKRFTAKA